MTFTRRAHNLMTIRLGTIVRNVNQEFGKNFTAKGFSAADILQGTKNKSIQGSSVRKTRPGHAHAGESYVGHAMRTGCGGGLENERRNDEFYLDL